MQKEQIKFNGYRYAFKLSGAGPLVVLIHGFGENATVWENQVHALEGYQLLIPDLPGSGDSDLTPGLSMENMADVIFEMTKAVNKSGKPVLLGHSMGGYVLMAFMERHPEKAAAIGLIHSTSLADAPERKAKRQEGIRKIQEQGAAIFFEGMIPGLFSEVSKIANPGMVQAQVQKAAHFSAEASIAYQTAMMQRPDRQDILKNWGKPVLLILGAEDTTIPLEAGAKNATLAENLSFHVLKSSGHMGMLEEPGTFNQIILDFLGEVL